MQQYRDMLNLSYVKRWVILPTDREQSVAEHSFRVAAIAMALVDCYRVTYPDSFNGMGLDWIIRHSLTHDLEEVYTGDIPGTDKDKSKPWPSPAVLLPGEIVVKLADTIETWSWGVMHVTNPLTRPNAFDSTPTGRDFRKIIHYTEGWPEMRETVRQVVGELFGGLTMEGV